MRKKDIEIKLERLRSFENPSASLEQYPTPATIASDIIFQAFVNGDVCDKNVNDLGCGTGIFAIGAKLAGANEVYGFDISESAIGIAEENSRNLGTDIRFEVCDIRDVDRRADTTFMNPPFGCQTKHADQPFLEKAMDLTSSIYSIHMAGTLDFLRDFAESRGREIVSSATYKYNIPHTFTFHSKTKQTVDVIVVNIR